MSTVIEAGELQKIFNHPSLSRYNGYSQHIFKQLYECHTLSLGMHHYRCDDPDCNHLHQQYHSCGNRHCPNCGGLKKEQWIENLTAQLFPTSYYHVVFTVPHELNALTLGNRKEMFTLLFQSASATLLQFGQDPQYLGAVCGVTSVLHTWGQDLSFHPHLHCIVSGGGIKDNNWVAARRSNDKFLFPVLAMKKVYKGIFLKKLRRLLALGQLKTKGLDVTESIKKAGYKNWKIYAKSPFGSVASVIEYLGRYTHKTAITRHRMVGVTEHGVTFNYKDYADGSRQKLMSLNTEEFLRRFELHFLPRGFVKIRHYGFLQNHGKTTRLNAVRANMQLQPLPVVVNIPVSQRMLERYGKDISLCPKCHKGKLVLVAIIYPKIFQVNLSNPVGKVEQPTLNNKASP